MHISETSAEVKFDDEEACWWNLCTCLRLGMKIKIEVLPDNEEMLSVEVLRPFCATAATAMAPPPVHRMFNFFNTVQY